MNDEQRLGFLRDFNKWLEEPHKPDDTLTAVEQAQKKIEELKIKYKIGQTTTG